MRGLKLGVAAAALGLIDAGCSDAEPKYELEAVTGPSPFHGIHGLTVTKAGKLLAGSVVGRAIYEVDRETGETSVFEGPPTGMADDIEEGPDGSLAWTDDGRLFATQVFLGDALYELDPGGANPPRKIMEGMGGLNGFDFGPDGKLYGPLWFRKQAVRVDVDAGTLEVIAEGFATPAAVNFNSKGELYLVDAEAGHVYRVDIDSGEKTLVAEGLDTPEGFDIAPDGRILVAEVGAKRIAAIALASGKKTVIKDDLPNGLAAPDSAPPLFIPTGVAIAENGDIYFLSDMDARIYRLRKG